MEWNKSDRFGIGTGLNSQVFISCLVRNRTSYLFSLSLLNILGVSITTRACESLIYIFHKAMPNAHVHEYSESLISVADTLSTLYSIN